jgi:hypothetical protein
VQNGLEADLRVEVARHLLVPARLWSMATK